MIDHDPSLDPEFSAGDRIQTEIGEFEVQQVLGAGGMGVVYQVVRDERHGGRQFALKTILPELLNRREVVQRFEAEGRVLARFDHENIIKIDGIYTMHSKPPRPFILMELLQGYTLRYVMDQFDEPLSVNDVCTVALGVCNALEQIHETGVVHRDIKPENIFIQKRRKHTRVVLIDFGIMKLVLGGGKHTTNFFLGSYSNASPEQLLGQPVTPRSDFYSLGTALYEMLTGGPLFPGVEDSRAIGQAHIDRKPVPLHEVAPQVPLEISDIVMRALDKDPSARPKDAHAFRQPFSTVRNRLLRDQAQNAGHSTIERFLSNTVGVERMPMASASKGHTVRLPALQSSELRDTTAPSAPLWGGTQPDLPGDVALEPTAPSRAAITRPERSSKPVEAAPAPSVNTRPSDPPPVQESVWEPPSGLASIPIQPPAHLIGGPGTDPTSTRDVPTRTVPPGTKRLPTQNGDSVVLPLHSSGMRNALFAIGTAGVVVATALVGQALIGHSRSTAPSLASSTVESPLPTVQAPPEKPAPIAATPSAMAPAASIATVASPSTSTASSAQAAVAGQDSGASGVSSAAHRSPPPATPKVASHAAKAAPSASAGSMVDLFEDISAHPAAPKKLPGSDF